jgi:hypothetical protein
MPRVFDLIKPLDNRDTYAITDVVFQKGGLREVANTTAMRAISAERRTSGMIAFVISTGEFYGLTGGDLTNDSWEKIDFSKNVIGNLNPKQFAIEPSQNSSSNQQGENLSLNVSNTSIIRVYNGNSISSISDSNSKDGKLLFLQNLSESNIIIKNDYLKDLNNFNNFINDQIGLTKISFNGDSDNYIMTSSEGSLLKSNDLENWTTIQNIDSNSWESIAQSDAVFVAVSSDGDNRVVFSTDSGNTWTPVAVEEYAWKSITYKNGLFIAVAEAKAMYSVDGLEWTYVDLPDKEWKQIVYGKQTFVTIAETLDGDDDICYSIDDGATWEIANKPNTNINLKIRFINDKFYIITDQNILVSSNGISWSVFNFPFNSEEIQEIIYNNNYYFFIKKDIVYYTDDLNVWREFAFQNTNEYIDFAIKNDKYYLIYTNGIDELEIISASDSNYSIITGTNLELIFLKNSSILLQFSYPDDAWRVIGGVSLNPTLVSLLDVADEYPTVPVNNNVFLSVNPNVESEDKVVFNNPFPITENDDEDLVIDHINGLRIRRFNSTTGELVFAKFTPTISMSIPSALINFDDEITTITGLTVTNDTFVPTVKLTTVSEVFYFKNDNDEDVFNFINISPVIPYENINHTWTQGFTFDAIQDINENFGTSPSAITIVAKLVDTADNQYEINRTITYKEPDFSFTIDSEAVEFTELINTCNLSFTYTNVTSKEDYAEIYSIEALLPNFLGELSNVSFTNLAYGMEDYVAENLNINPDNITKTNNLTDTGVFTFTVICRYHRPFSIDEDENYYEIEQTANLNVSFDYPIFIGNTSIDVTELVQSDVINTFTNSESTALPRIFTQIVDDENLHFWFCLRKRYVNNRLPIVTLSSNGFSSQTEILGSNEIEITSSGSFETYVCYYVLLQANNTYSINIAI